MTSNAMPRAAMRALGAALALAAGLGGGCIGEDGLLSVKVVTAPESTLMGSVVKIRMTLTQPRKVVEAERQADGGFSLSLEVPAENSGSSQLLVEGYDENERLIAYGSSPQFAVNPTNASLAIYLAPPLSIGEAPVKLPVGRYEVGVATLTYGAIFVGGRDNNNTIRGEVEIYNAYNHTLVSGMPLPMPRSAAAVGTVVDGRAFIVGGRTGDGAAAPGGWQFNTNVAPSGSYSELVSTAAGRVGARAVAITAGRFFLTGSPPADLDALIGTVTPLPSAPTLPSEMVSVAKENEVVAIGVGETVVRFRNATFDQLSIPSALRTDHSVVAMADGNVAVIGGKQGDDDTGDVVKIDPLTGMGTVLPDLLHTPRRAAAVARAGKYIVVAGGIGAATQTLGDAELLDATTLEHLGTIPLVAPRSHAEALPLPNGQVLIVGGLLSNGRPTDRIELFTGEPE